MKERKKERSNDKRINKEKESHNLKQRLDLFKRLQNKSDFCKKIFHNPVEQYYHRQKEHLL